MKVNVPPSSCTITKYPTSYVRNHLIVEFSCVLDDRIMNPGIRYSNFDVTCCVHFWIVA